MAGISAPIGVTDHMTPILNNITNALNIMLGAMERTQTATDTGFDASVIAGAREEIFGAEAALIQYQEQLDRLNQKKSGLPTPTAPAVPEAPSWQSSMPVFTNSGTERFQLEIDAANTSMQEMLQTQAEISQKALNMKVMPAGMTNDMTGIHNRMQQLQARIQELNRIPLNMRTDAVNNELEILRGNQDRVKAAQDRLNTAMAGMDIGEINAAYLNLDQAVGSVERNIRDNTRVQDQFNDKVQQGGDALSKLTHIAAALGIGMGVKSLVEMSDSVTQTYARLDMMNDGLQTTDELQQMIFESAQSSRASYTAAADSVAKLGNNAKAAFSNNEELVRFSELVNKQFAIAGASSQEASNAFLQLTQAMGSGVLRGDELNSIFEQAPNLIQTIADYMGKDIGEMRNLASEGAITADIIKNAMLAAGTDIDEVFEGMPMTWGQAMTVFKNEAMMQLQPLLERINELANDEAIQSLMAGMAQMIGFVASAGVALIDILAEGIQDMQPFLPFLISVGAAVGAVVLATKLWAVAQMLLNLAMSPMGIAVLIIIGIVAAIYFLVNAFNSLTGSTVSATGIIMGILTTLGAIIGNVFIYIWNRLAIFINFFANVFKDPVASIKILFLDMALNVLDYIRNIAEGIETLLNKIPGVSVNITAGLDNLHDSIEQASKNIKDKSEWEEVVKQKEYIEFEGAWKTGYGLGEGVDDFLGGFNPEDLLPKDKKGEDSSSDTNGILEGIADDTSSVADSVEITEEDLKYLKDIAEQDAINRFTTAEIKVDLGGVTNQVSGNTDLDGMINYLAGSLEQQMAIMAEGVH